MKVEKLSLDDFDGFNSEEEAVKCLFGVEIKTTRISISCGLWEEKDCELIENYVSRNDFCKHAIPIGKIIFHDSELVMKFYQIPKVLIATNEGGYNTTGICVDCLLENLSKRGK